ncbi:AAEL006444-PA, partial [Aedes aegypti]
FITWEAILKIYHKSDNTRPLLILQQISFDWVFSFVFLIFYSQSIAKFYIPP